MTYALYIDGLYKGSTEIVTDLYLLFITCVICNALKRASLRYTIIVEESLKT